MSTPHTPDDATMGQDVTPQQPTVFAKRAGDCYVPMIALDELPHNFSLVGVPTTLTEEEVSKITVKQVVWADKSAETWTVRYDCLKIKTESDTGDVEARHVPSHRAINVHIFHDIFFFTL